MKQANKVQVIIKKEGIGDLQNMDERIRQVEVSHEKFVKTVDRRFCSIEKQLSETIRRETKDCVQNVLSDSVEKSLKRIIPKVDALLSKREVASLGVSDDIPTSNSSPNTSSSSLYTSANQRNFFEAANVGDVANFKRLMREGASAHQRNKKGETPLHIGAAAGHVQVLKELLDAGANVDVIGPCCRTPLHWSAAGGHLDATRQFVSAGAQVDAKDRNCSTPLMLAVPSSHLNVTSYLLSVGASPLVSDKNGDNPLLAAIKKGRLDIVKCLIHNSKTRAKVDSVNLEKTPLIVASEIGNVEIMAELLKNNINEGEDDVEKALCSAENAGIIWAFEDAIPGILLSKSGIRAFWEAVRRGRKEVREAFVDARVDVNIKDSGGNCALLIAAKNGHAECISSLLQIGADKNSRDCKGWNALHWSSDSGHWGCVRVLLDSGLNANSLTNFKSTPLMLSAANGHSDCVSLLLGRSADKYLKNYGGWDALRYASQKQHEQCVRLLK